MVMITWPNCPLFPSLFAMLIEIIAAARKNENANGAKHSFINAEGITMYLEPTFLTLRSYYLIGIFF